MGNGRGKGPKRPSPIEGGKRSGLAICAISCRVGVCDRRVREDEGCSSRELGWANGRVEARNAYLGKMTVRREGKGEIEYIAPAGTKEISAVTSSMA